MSEPNKPTFGSALFSLFLQTVVLSPISALYSGFLLTKMWPWFFEPALTLRQGVGSAFLVGLTLAGTHVLISVQNQQEATPGKVGAVTAAVHTLLFVSAYITHLVIG
jgi:hypothetical protein